MPESVLWPIPPHTTAKHDILSYYLKAWFPILATGQRRLVVIDGFAGPGEYMGGEPGSPILVLQTALDHKFLPKLTRPGMELVFLFVEERQDLFENLQARINALKLPANFEVELRLGAFETAMGEVLRHLEAQGALMAPALIFIDPFGPTGFPMHLVERISRQPRAEVLINFPYQPLNQWFLSVPPKHPRLDELYGDGRWRPALAIDHPRQREEFLVGEYRRALAERGWRGTQFRMVNKHNQTQYYLLFGTKHWRGNLVMKQAMWSVAPEGDFQYSDLSNPAQQRLFSAGLDTDYARELADQIFENRRGTATSKENLIQNEVAWHPTCIERHLTRALLFLEYESDPARIVTVVKADGTRRNSRTYPGGCRITFAS